MATAHSLHGHPSPDRVLADEYSFRDEHAVQPFIAQHPEVVPVLLEGYDAIQKYIPHTSVYLEVVPDYDSLDERYYVLASIATNLAPVDAIARLEDFDRA